MTPHSAVAPKHLTSNYLKTKSSLVLAHLPDELSLKFSTLPPLLPVLSEHKKLPETNNCLLTNTKSTVSRFSFTFTPFSFLGWGIPNICSLSRSLAYTWAYFTSSKGPLYSLSHHVGSKYCILCVSQDVQRRSVTPEFNFRLLAAEGNGFCKQTFKLPYGSIFIDCTQKLCFGNKKFFLPKPLWSVIYVLRRKSSQPWSFRPYCILFAVFNNSRIPSVHGLKPCTIWETPLEK